MLAIKTEQGSLRIVQLCGPLSNAGGDPLADRRIATGLDGARPADADKLQ
jgi:hypothetical protein